MHSIPHEPFHNFSTLLKFRPFKSMSYKGCGNVPTRNRVGGGIFLAQKWVKLGMEMGNLMFFNAKGDGVSFLGMIVPNLGIKTPPLRFSVQKW